MARAIQLARRGLYGTDPNPRVGCVLVKQGRIVGEGWHASAGAAHAEVVALQNAGAAARGVTCYTTLEPCSHTGRTGPCTQALLQAGVKRVVSAMQDPNPDVAGRGFQALQQAGLEVSSGLLEVEAAALNPGFISRMTRRRPWLRLKQAASVDGRTALASGEGNWITSEAARADVQRWRARSSAILTGVGTVLHDDPRLDVRIETPRQPRRIILDSKARTPSNARLFKSGGEVVMFVAEDVEPDAGLKNRAHIEFVPENKAGLNLFRVVERLAQMACNEVQVEAGPVLAGALLEAGLVDEWLLYLAPSLLGDQALPLARMPLVESLPAGLQFVFQECRRVGPDLRLVLKRQ